MPEDRHAADVATIEAVCDALPPRRPACHWSPTRSWSPRAARPAGPTPSDPEAPPAAAGHRHHPQPAGGRGAARPAVPASRGDAGGGAGAAGAGRPGRAAEGRPPRRRAVVDILATPDGITRFADRGSRRGTPMAPAAPWPRPSPPAWRRAWPGMLCPRPGLCAHGHLAAPGFGRGHGPLDHGVTLDPARLAAL